jgi:hypothetical protein
LLASGIVTEPQSWNRYAYVGNRPTVITDPSGMLWYILKLDNGNYVVKWFDYNPGGDWKEIQMDMSRVYRAANGHFIILNKNDKRWIDLTAEAMKEESIQKMKLAKEKAEAYCNAILINFFSISIEAGVAIDTLGGARGELARFSRFNSCNFYSSSILVMRRRFESELFDQSAQRDIAQARQVGQQFQPVGVRLFDLAGEFFQFAQFFRVDRFNSAFINQFVQSSLRGGRQALIDFKQ